MIIIKKPKKKKKQKTKKQIRKRKHSRTYTQTCGKGLQFPIISIRFCWVGEYLYITVRNLSRCFLLLQDWKLKLYLEKGSLRSTCITAKIYKSKVGDHSGGWPEGSLFNSYYTEMLGNGATPFSRLLHFTLDTYLIMLSARQGDTKNHFLSLWYDSTWDWTLGSNIYNTHTHTYTHTDIYIYIYIIQTSFIKDHGIFFSLRSSCEDIQVFLLLFVLFFFICLVHSVWRAVKVSY